MLASRSASTRTPCWCQSARSATVSCGSSRTAVRSSTIVGVGLFIVTQATTSGFEKFYVRAILGTDGAVRIEDKLQDTLRSMNADGPGLSGDRDGRKLVEGVDDPTLVINALMQFD